MKKLLKAYKIHYKDLSFYERAMIHPSYQNEMGLEDNNQRLEFLGDAVIELIVSDFLFLNLKADEGELSKLRAAIVCEESLAKMARKIGLQDQLLLGRGEESIGGRKRDSTLSDAFEAFVAGIFLDLGLEGAREFFLGNFMEELVQAKSGLGFVDYKSRLQILCQKDGRRVSYKTLDARGPDHKKIFSVGLYIDDKLVSQGQGSSKREAQQRAAQEALVEKL